MAEPRSEPVSSALFKKMLRLLGKELDLPCSSLEMQTETSGLGSWLPPGKHEGIGHPAPREQYVGNNVGKWDIKRRQNAFEGTLENRLPRVHLESDINRRMMERENTA